MTTWADLYHDWKAEVQAGETFLGFKEWQERRTDDDSEEDE